jgi:hypothetical protein
MRTNSQGKAREGYILSSVGDQASIKQLFDQAMRDGVPDTVVGVTLAGWHVVEANEKNASPLPMPPSCGSPENAK